MRARMEVVSFRFVAIALLSYGIHSLCLALTDGEATIDPEVASVDHSALDAEKQDRFGNLVRL